MKKKRRKNLLIAGVFIAGALIMLYPSISNLWNSFRASVAIDGYKDELSQIDIEKQDEMLTEAEKYNAARAKRGTYKLSEEEKKNYERQLKIGENGVMGYLAIDAIGVKLPIYHGSSEIAMQRGIGHLEWSSLPVGGKGTHSVLSGHTGLPSAKLLTDLDKMEIGDIFTISVLNREMTYQVDQIKTVLPYNTEYIQIEKGRDLCTLVTCTPYGVNSHRLLVRGHRISNRKPVRSEERRYTKYIVICLAVLFAAPIVVLLIRGKKKGR